MKLLNTVKLVAGNCVVLLGMLAAVNLASLIVLKGYMLSKGLAGAPETEV